MAKLGKKTQRILDFFKQVSDIPRQSKHEEKICRWLLDWAAKEKFDATQDKTGNIIIRVPATKGYEKSDPVILQGHVDMVCEKTPESGHDFSRDPIKLVEEGDWMHADKTSLGADNGIAIAMAMALATDTSVPHPPLELLFTVDEETGLTGALGLESGVLKGTKLLNIDSEDEGVFTIGCAGGRETHITLPLHYHEVPEHYVPFHLTIKGLTGGHSGVNIHEGRANALKLMSRSLRLIRDESPLHVVYINGGTAHNAIPRSVEARFFIPEDQAPKVSDDIRTMGATFKREFSHTDPNIEVILAKVDTVPDRRAMSEASTERTINFLLAFPHGVSVMSKTVPGLVETSNNFASVKVEGGNLEIVSSQRSSVMTKLNAITKRVEAVAALAGAAFQSNVGYPSWEPNPKSALLETFKTVYKKLFKKEAHVEAIHAGLECGLIGNKYPGMDMISFGVTIKNPHCPDEKMHLPSIEKVWNLLAAVVQELK